MENTCNYSDQWQPYTGDYDKFEYDIMLHGGEVVKNCYPNAGKFHSYGDQFKDQVFTEDQIDQIRFSQVTRLDLGNDYSQGQEDVEYRKRRVEAYFNVVETMFITNPYAFDLSDTIWTDGPRRKIVGRPVEVRTQPKIGRNQVCPKCDSGKKYKKCCIGVVEVVEDVVPADSTQ